MPMRLVSSTWLRGRDREPGVETVGRGTGNGNVHGDGKAHRPNGWL
jgi:hypothetical protein